MTTQPDDYIATREGVRAYLDRALLDVETDLEANQSCTIRLSRN